MREQQLDVSCLFEVKQANKIVDEVRESGRQGGREVR